MFNINTGNLNLLFSSVSYYRINYLDEIYWIVTHKSEIWKIDFGYIHLKLEFFFLFFFLHSAIMKQDTETILHKMNFILLII